ncbi:MAG: DMT family transporter [Alphaproteobacteria bacterium]|nr:MAG: DMT family transporter [Alphaproteobacteria bacterium]
MTDSTATNPNRGDSSTWPRGVLFAALLAGNVSLALGAWLVRLTDTGPVSAAFWRLFLVLPVFALIAHGAGQRLGGIARRPMVLVAFGAVAFALDLALWHVGIGYTRLGNATLFGNAGSIVLMVWGFIVARALPQRFESIAILFSLTGAGILMGRSLEISQATLVGDLLSLGAGLLYAVYIVALQDARREVGSWSMLFWVSVYACPVLLAMGIMLGEPVLPTNWTPVVALAITSQLVGQGLVVFSLRHFSPLVIGLALLTQPAVAALTGYLAFGEVLMPLDIFGMALLGAALVVARAKRG